MFLPLVSVHERRLGEPLESKQDSVKYIHEHALAGYNISGKQVYFQDESQQQN